MKHWHTHEFLTFLKLRIKNETSLTASWGFGDIMHHLSTQVPLPAISYILCFFLVEQESGAQFQLCYVSVAALPLETLEQQEKIGNAALDTSPKWGKKLLMPSHSTCQPSTIWILKAVISWWLRLWNISCSHINLTVKLLLINSCKITAECLQYLYCGLKRLKDTRHVIINLIMFTSPCDWSLLAFK